MTFAIYRQRTDPWTVAYDFQLFQIEDGIAADFDCVAVFSIPAGATRYTRLGVPTLGVVDGWSLKDAAAVLCGDYRPVKGKAVVPVERLWRLKGAGVPRRHPEIAISMPRVYSRGEPFDWS